MTVFETPFYNLIVTIQLRNPRFPRQQSQGGSQIETGLKFRRTLIVDLDVAEIDVFRLFFG